ncbi:MAG: hypothetical protein ACI835_001097 [Planctomycetota bacterium]
MYFSILDNVIALKFMAALGISKDLRTGFSGGVTELVGRGLKKMGKEIDKGNDKNASKIGKRIMDKLLSKRFTNKLAQKVGKKAADKIMAKIGSKLIPYLGWGLFLGTLVWEIGERIFD